MLSQTMIDVFQLCANVNRKAVEIRNGSQEYMYLARKGWAVEYEMVYMNICIW